MLDPQVLPEADDPEAALAAVVSLRRLAGRLEIAAVAEAISQGWTWAQVGEALGVTAQAAHKKFASEVRARRADSEGTANTAEVRARRDSGGGGKA